MDGTQSAMSSDEPDSPGLHAVAAPRVLNRPEGRDQQKRKKRGGVEPVGMEAFQKSLADMAASDESWFSANYCDSSLMTSHINRDENNYV
ncbi:unnamed protein product [Linum trigynum]|uniref:Uncharacterized protein n=1 Tax=Linum trigynum TaxID=586398 RepID=A0AAV2FGD0_9ROSI